ncbi:MAG TPA: RNA polymerase sigma factor [Fimbriimonas sp.]|nr:RNA polymerase sigma factor [Fimbriimonas sp.]
MSAEPSRQVRESVEELYRQEGARVLSSLIRLIGDFDLAEDAMQEAFSAALQQWPSVGIPANPRAWLISAGRFKAIDVIRRRARLNERLEVLAARLESEAAEMTDAGIEDDRLRLIFTCCHPALPEEAQVALTLREVCGLTTEEIARAFLSSAPAIAQRIVRAKAKIRDDKIPYELPDPSELSERLQSVLRVSYLVFNEGYYASSGYSLTRQPLSLEAIRLGRLLVELLPESEVFGLLALMLLQESRRAARTSPSGDLILLDEQDRSRWNENLIAEGLDLVQKAFASNRPGPYGFQAAIVAVHAVSPTSEKTDWARIVSLYDRLLEIHPSSVVELNRAVAVAMRDGAAQGLVLVDELLANRGLSGYGLAHSARADLCRRLGQNEEAERSYRRALELATQEPEKRFLQRRLDELSVAKTRI